MKPQVLKRLMIPVEVQLRENCIRRIVSILEEYHGSDKTSLIEALQSINDIYVLHLEVFVHSDGTLTIAPDQPQT